MLKNKLFILIEGDDDERFFKAVINPILEKKYLIILYKYAQETKKKINALIKSTKNKNLYADYLFVTDIDNNPCVTAKKEKIKEKHPINDDINKISVVIKEIESWYLAGLSDKDSKEIIGKKFKDTNTIIKEQFDNYKPKRFDSSIDFMIEVLKHFSVNIAKKKNTSFNYFMEKYTNI